MQQVYNDIKEAQQKGNKLLAVLLDPDKLEVALVEETITKINESNATHIFVGGSIVANGKTEAIVIEIKKYTTLPIVLFPGDKCQITNEADAILFLSLISGRNPEFLIEQQVQSASLLKHTNLEIIPTGYILIDGGVVTAVQKVSNTLPIPQEDIGLVENTALAGEYSGKQLIYLEAGSGAKIPVHTTIIKQVKNKLNIPLIVGGGIRSSQQLNSAYEAGADLVVIGTAFEDDQNFFKAIS